MTTPPSLFTEAPSPFVPAQPAAPDSAAPARTAAGTEQSRPADFEQLFHQAPCGYLLTGDDGTITAVNDSFLAWTGHRRADLVGTRLQQLLPVGDRILYTTHCIPKLELAGAVTEVVIDIVAADGTRQAALLSAARSVDTPADPVVRVIIFSAHERRLYEHELIAARRRAEQSEADRASAQADLVHLARHDPLTGLLNRAGLTEHLTTAVDQAGAGPGPAALVIDFDHFRLVNDSLGRAAGDELLRTVARRLQAQVRAEDCVARLSGDEFVVVEHSSDPAQAAALARRLLETLTAPQVVDGLEIVASASIGAAVANPADPDPDRLLRRAGAAMHRVKARGGGAWDLHDPARTGPATNWLQVLGELRCGIGLGQLRVHYQPRVRLADGTLHGVEALVRWQHPDRGLLAPIHFIGVAEASGLVRELGAWVLEEAVTQAVAWNSHRAGRPPVLMAVNLSTRQLTDPTLAATVAAVLDRHGLDPALLTLEITETALMEDPDGANAVLAALKALGVELAVDDFGTGYASLTYLKRFPVDELKIDQSFVRGLGSDPGDRAIVASCVQLAHAVGIRAVAEGVETDTHRQQLLALDCDYAQGYYYSRPQPPNELGDWLTGTSPHSAGPAFS